jgi:ABC-type Fe3+ transport system substrate-binding protein
MKRYGVLILFVIVLVAPWVVARFVNKGEKVEVAPGTARLDIVTPHNQDIRNEFAAAFSAWHQAKYGQAVTVLFNSPGGTGDIARLLEATYREGKTPDGKLRPSFKPPFDLVWGGGDRFFDREIIDYLEPTELSSEVLKSAFPEPTLAGAKLFDNKKATTAASFNPGGGTGPKWVGVCISSFGIVYNPDVYQGLGLNAPKTWADLGRPELAGWIALANPMSSTSAAVSYAMCYQRAMADEEDALLKTRPDLAKLPGPERLKDKEYKAAVARGWHRGMGQLLLIAANARYVTDSGSQPPNDVANGDAAAGMAIDIYGRANEATMGKDRITFVMPKGATAINADPIAIMLGVQGQQYTLANHFIEYLLTPEAQRKWITKPGEKDGPTLRALYRTPVRQDVYTTSNRDTWTHPDLNPFTDAMGFNQRSEWMTLFSQIKVVWATSWIDSREELKDAYKTILAVPDKSRRNELLARLADIPLTYADVEAWQKEVAALKPNDVDRYNAVKRREMAELFRKHYRSVAAQALAN